MPLHLLLSLLTGGDRRSIGRSPVVVGRVLRRPKLLQVLVQGLSAADPLVRMRAADALEKVSVPLRSQLRRYVPRLLRLAKEASEQELQWHLSQVLPRLALSPKQRTEARRIFRGYLASRSSIVQAMAVEALVQLAPDSRAGRQAVVRLLAEASCSPRAAVRARARRLGRAVSRPSRGSLRVE